MRQTLFLALFSSLLYPLDLAAATETVLANFTIYTDGTCTSNTDTVEIVATTSSGTNTCLTSDKWGSYTAASMNIFSLADNCEIELYNIATCEYTTSTYLGTYAPSACGPPGGCVQVPNTDSTVDGIGDDVQGYLVACSKTRARRRYLRVS